MRNLGFWGRLFRLGGRKAPDLSNPEVIPMADPDTLPTPPDAPAASPDPAPAPAPTLADLAAAAPPPAPTPDPVVTSPPSLEDLAKSVESAQAAHVSATEKANASAAQAQMDKDAQSVAHDALHSAVTALIAAAQADDPQ